MEKVISFSPDPETKRAILDLFGKAVNGDGFIVEKDNPAQRILTPDGDPLELGDFAGIRKGSLLFFKSDIASIIELSDRMR